jgi:hypothetical protein
VGDEVLLKVSPIKGIVRFGIKGKLSPRYIGPYLITARVGSLAYRLQLPESMAGLHPVFHVSMLRKYIRDPELKIKVDPELKTSACIGVLRACNAQLYYQVRKDLME